MIKCTFENGNPASLRHVTIDALVIKDGKVLLLKRAPHLIEGGKWCLPGGFMERDETTEQAVLRELKEESGYDGKIIKLFRIIDEPNRPNDDKQNVAFIYLVEVIGEPGERDNESTEMAWFDLDKIPAPEECAFDHRSNIELFLQS